MTGWLRAALAVLAAAALTLALLPLQLVGIRHDLSLARRLPRIWHRVAARLLGLNIRIHGELEPGRPLMLVANHASWIDIIALGSVADLVFVAKAEVRDWPVFGLLARWQRSVFVDRTIRRSAGQQIDAIAQRLDRGEIVALFAEGTTSDGNRVLPFKSSLLGAAGRAAESSDHETILLQPVAIAYTRLQGLPMGRRHRPAASWPGDVTLGPHLLTVLREGAIDVEITFGNAMVFGVGSNRKSAATALRHEVQAMLRQRLYGR